MKTSWSWSWSSVLGGVTVLVASGALAQEASADAMATARARIADGRAASKAEFEAAERACYRRFAVNDCIDDARVARREVERVLRAEEIELNTRERDRRTAERRAELAAAADEQAAEFARRAASGAANPIPAAPGSPNAAPATSAPASASPTAPTAAPAPSTATPGGRPRAPRQARNQPVDPSETAANAAAFEQKRRDAEARRAQVEERNRQRKAPPKPLPTTP